MAYGDADSSFQAAGGEAGIQRLVDGFYVYMDTLPVATHIRAMHPADLTTSREKLYEFLSGWLGGPALYVQKHGHPRID